MNDEKCEIMRELATSPAIHGLLIFYLLASIIALPVIIMSIYGVVKAIGFHFNTKSLFILHLTAMFVHCASRAVAYTIDLINYYSNWTNPCDIVPSTWRCFFTRIFFNAGYAYFEWTSFVLCVERFIATLYRSNYENSCRIVSLGLGFLQFSLTGMTLMCWYWYFHEQDVHYFCRSASRNNPTLIMVLNVLVIIALAFSQFGFKILASKNKALRKQEAEASLSKRYQLEENIRSNQILELFAIYDFWLLCVYNFSSIIVYLFPVQLTSVQYIVSTEVFLICPIYSILVPYVVWRKYRERRRITNTGLQNAINVSNDQYFAQFRSAWE